MDYASSRDAMDLYSFDFPPMEERAGRRLSEVFGSSRDLYEILKEVGGVQGSKRENGTDGGKIGFN